MERQQNCTLYSTSLRDTQRAFGKKEVEFIFLVVHSIRIHLVLSRLLDRMLFVVHGIVHGIVHGHLHGDVHGCLCPPGIVYMFCPPGIVYMSCTPRPALAQTLKP